MGGLGLMLAGSKFSKIRRLVAKIWAVGGERNHHGYGLVVFIVYGPNPLDYVGTIMWQEKVLTRKRSFLTPVFCARGGDGSNKLEPVAQTKNGSLLVLFPAFFVWRIL